LEIALQEFGGSITGRKRYQSSHHAHLSLFEKQSGKIKINPLASGDITRVNDYITINNLPRHPLVAQGFPSIGRRSCTTKAKEHKNPKQAAGEESRKLNVASTSTIKTCSHCPIFRPLSTIYISKLPFKLKSPKSAYPAH
jgi:3'-phosphoadenosine 5'-phosphosulfate sulfotransferase (PAPS reductase)/FAD synthetase